MFSNVNLSSSDFNWWLDILSVTGGDTFAHHCVMNSANGIFCLVIQIFIEKKHQSIVAGV